MQPLPVRRRAPDRRTRRKEQPRAAAAEGERPSAQVGAAVAGSPVPPQWADPPESGAVPVQRTLLRRPEREPEFRRRGRTARCRGPLFHSWRTPEPCRVTFLVKDRGIIG